MTVSARGRTSLPDIEDELLKARLQPLADRVLPGRVSTGAGDPPSASREGLPAEAAGTATPADAATPHQGATTFHAPDRIPVFRTTGLQETRQVPQPAAGALAAAERVERTRAARGPRKGVEFLLPDRVVQALRVAAAQDGVTMSVKLLEVLRTAGYPVIDEDFVDLRRLPKR
ncbi:hypothetical protein [Roseicella aquatilis]|uniref:Uncharacterized protein n=1 Tax=Roseicella aquatilis TaxID=2527868 RepID=A0A4V2WJI9_9PROT|nr:hypothetical protein [Roseicella aquatilis]TCZ53901.1 hypothetical protein EXY23_24145 [Roseicella aquatilis]